MRFFCGWGADRRPGRATSPEPRSGAGPGGRNVRRAEPAGPLDSHPRSAASADRRPWWLGRRSLACRQPPPHRRRGARARLGLGSARPGRRRQSQLALRAERRSVPASTRSDPQSVAKARIPVRAAQPASVPRKELHRSDRRDRPASVFPSSQRRPVDYCGYLSPRDVLSVCVS